MNIAGAAAKGNSKMESFPVGAESNLASSSPAGLEPPSAPGLRSSRLAILASVMAALGAAVVWNRTAFVEMPVDRVREVVDLARTLEESGRGVVPSGIVGKNEPGELEEEDAIRVFSYAMDLQKPVRMRLVESMRAMSVEDARELANRMDGLGTFERQEILVALGECSEGQIAAFSGSLRSVHSLSRQESHQLSYAATKCPSISSSVLVAILDNAQFEDRSIQTNVVTALIRMDSRTDAIRVLAAIWERGCLEKEDMRAIASLAKAVPGGRRRAVLEESGCSLEASEWIMKEWELLR